jgi:membrane-bound lytic murein transglycosylase D
MKKFVIGLLIVLSQTLTFAQGPRVPNKMSIGNMRIKITDGARAEIQKNVDDLTRHPKYFNAKVDLANQYFHFIEEAFRQEGVPEEIKYLVIQESGLISDAVSTSNAVGYWQFKDFTAVEVGLRVDRNIDERKNIYAASMGAAKYLKKNNGYFDNWLYAVQAYQMGAGGALKVTNKKLYGAKQMTITKKTYWYVKKYLAHKVAFEDAVGKSKPSVYLSVYKSASGKSLNDVAKIFKLNEEELAKYNKWLRKGKVPSDKKYAVIVPNKQLVKIAEGKDKSSKPKKLFVKKVPSYNQAQAKLFPVIKSWRGRAEYSGRTVNVNRLPGIVGQSGDKLIDLAKKGNLSLSDFLNINDIEIDHRVIEGTAYYFKKKKSKAKLYYHVVHSGETLWSISQKYGLSLKKLLTKNRLTESGDLKVGRVLWTRHIRPEHIAVAYEEMDDLESVAIKVNISEPISEKEIMLDTISQDTISHLELSMIPVTNLQIDTIGYNQVKHIVKRGETYYSIANRYNVRVLKLVQDNQLKLSDKLSIDQQLTILVPFDQEEEISDSEEFKLFHVVEKGETLYSISKKYSVSIEEIIRINDKENGEIAIGEQIKLSNYK